MIHDTWGRGALPAPGGPGPLAPGSKLAERYEIASELGRGGMGVVYAARDPVLGRDVAVKVITPSLLSPEIEGRFRREAQIVAALDHPGVVPIFDFGRHEGSLFSVMPLLAGATLRALITSRDLRLGDVLEILAQIGDALAYSHGRGVVHRDVKPENVMVLREGSAVRVRVMDFGLATTDASSPITQAGMLIGTLAYFSPEQIASRAMDGRADVYALGTVAYECLAGEPPFTGDLHTLLYRISHEPPRALASLGVDVPDELDALLLRSLEKDAARRPQTAAEVAETFRRCRDGLDTEGLARPVLGPRGRARATRTSGPLFVGREKERALLQERLAAARAGECQLVLVGGEPGVGKTRIVEELERSAISSGVRVRRARFGEQDQAFAFQGFYELVQDHLRAEARSGDATDFSDFAEELLALFPLLGELAPFRGLSARAGAAVRRPEDRTAMFELMARTVARIVSDQPTLLVLEDLHAAGVSLDALAYVVRRLSHTPVLVAGTYRTTEVDRAHALSRLTAAFAGDPRVLVMTLPRLSASECSRLVETLIGGARLGEGLGARVYEVTEGNPLFTAEVVRSLLESGSLARDASGGWTLSGELALSAAELPATVQQVVVQRVERLPEATRDVLATASVLGRAFSYRDLEGLAPDVRDLDRRVEDLVGEGLLEEGASKRADRLAFASGVVREVLYGTLSARRRRSLHRRHAEQLEARHAGRLERVWPQLLHHFWQGDVPEKTVHYGMALARTALSTLSADEALRALRPVAECLDEEGFVAEPGFEGELRRLFASAHRLAGNLEAAFRDAEAAVRAYEKDGRPAEAVDASLLAADLAWQRRRVDDARRWLDGGLQRARALGPSPTLRALLSLAATISNLRGEYDRARELLAEAERAAPVVEPAPLAVPDGGRLVIGLANPLVASAPWLIETFEESEVLGNVFETLVANDGTGHLRPALAERWELLDGATRLVLSLRRDVSFSDGGPLTAHHVAASFERALASPVASQRAVWAQIARVTVLDDATLELRLREALPFFPAMLADQSVAIARGEGVDALGTGPFAIAERDGDRIVLRRNEHRRGTDRAHLDTVEIRAALPAAAMAEAFRRGEIDVARDLRPEDLDALSRIAGVQRAEVARRGTYFAALSAGVPEDVRRALVEVVRVPDLVWRALGRFAQPAAGLIPPGMLGHDAGRRFTTIPIDEARARLEGRAPLRLRAAVHPILQDRHRAFTQSLFDTWAAVGVEVSVVTANLGEFITAWSEGGPDLLLGRYGADYDDPDNFTYAFFHSRAGHLRRWFQSPAFDDAAQAARQENRPGLRETAYRRLEAMLLEAGIVLPLFHEIDYRLASRRVRGVHLHPTAPYLRYAALGCAEPGEAEPQASTRSVRTLRVDLTNTVASLDPNHAVYVDEVEVTATVFECLTRVTESAQAVPWLAERFEAEDGGRRYRFLLRPDVSFHDGRRLTARDVRWSFERLLQSREALRNRLILEPVRGAREVMDGRRAELSGFRIVSAREFVLELTEPLPYLPTLLSHVPAAILPDGTGPLRPDVPGGCVGTGPFRVTRFEPGKLVELERHPEYWRPGLPQAERLVFRLEVPPVRIAADFRAARTALAGALMPSDIETLRRRNRYAAAYRETLGLSTYFVALNASRGPLKDDVLRQRLFASLDVGGIVRRCVGRLGVPARTLIPPGLLGQEPEALAEPSAMKSPTGARQELTAAVHPVFQREYAEFTGALMGALEQRGFTVRVVTSGWEDFEYAVARGTADLACSRWFADYPDADNFAGVLLETGTGDVGAMCGSADFDSLVGRARVESDPAARQAIYRELEERLRREARLLPLFHEQVYRFVRPEVQGARLRVCGGPIVPYEELLPGPRPPRVLIADDDQELREFVATLLEDAGFAVDLAADGREALEAIGASAPDLVLLDMRMPGTDGFAVLEQAHASGIAVPIVAVSGQGESPRALQAGAVAVLPKPFTPSQLLATCERVLGRLPA